eukprot:scaffold6812_cov85-Isochrysis_galbana.AAC.4
MPPPERAAPPSPHPAVVLLLGCQVRRANSPRPPVARPSTLSPMPRCGAGDAAQRYAPATPSFPA